VTNTLIFVTAICVAVFMAIHPTQRIPTIPTSLVIRLAAVTAVIQAHVVVARRKFVTALLELPSGQVAATDQAGEMTKMPALALVLALTATAAHAQQTQTRSFYDRSGSFAGSSVTRGNTTSMERKGP